MVIISQVEVLITLVVITSNSKCFSFFLYFRETCRTIYFRISCLKMIDAAPLQTIVDEDEGDSDIEIVVFIFLHTRFLHNFITPPSRISPLP